MLEVRSYSLDGKESPDVGLSEKRCIRERWESIKSQKRARRWNRSLVASTSPGGNEREDVEERTSWIGERRLTVRIPEDCSERVGKMGAKAGKPREILSMSSVGGDGGKGDGRGGTRESQL